MSRNESIFYMVCNSGLLSKTDIFIVHTSSYKKFYQFCTVSRTNINSTNWLCIW